MNHLVSADGISQPQIDWDEQRQTPCTQLEYTNIVALGEFLLGYRNEYGKITDRPLLDPDAANAELLSAVDTPAKKDLGRNGTYLVMRQLEQDVRGFWKFLYEQAGGSLEEADQLGAKMVGRARAGDPLVPIQAEPIRRHGSAAPLRRINLPMKRPSWRAVSFRRTYSPNKSAQQRLS